MSKTPHCVCSATSSIIDSSLRHPSNEMPSPPLPPRTLKANLSPTKNTQWPFSQDTSICDKDKLQCSCHRPHSCPADDGSPPVPPKGIVQLHNNNRSKYHTNSRRLDDQRKSDPKIHEPHRSSRKSSGRHNSSDGGKTRKKSRSKSRHLAMDDKLIAIRPTDDECYFLKKHDNLMERNCELFYNTNKEFIDGNVNIQFCTDGKLSPKPVIDVPQTKPPDLIPNRSNSTKVPLQSSPLMCTTDNPLKASSKSRMKKWFSFLMKSKKPTTTATTTTTTPDALNSAKSPDMSDRPRRSKSLHVISSSLSPTTSMQANSNVISSPDTKTKTTGILAVISPTTSRLKRNLLCISPKANTNAHKKQAATLPVVNCSNLSKSILSDNCQQRAGLSSISGGIRLSPVHLLAANNATKESYCFESCSNQNHYNISNLNFGNGADRCRGHRHRLDGQEKGNINDMDCIKKSFSVFKVHHSNHQETSQRKTPQSTNQISCPVFVNNSINTATSNNQLCSCHHHYRATTTNDSNINCPCTNNQPLYHHYHQQQPQQQQSQQQSQQQQQQYCPSHPIVSTSCAGCMHNNIVQYNPANHFHCVNGQQNVWCLVACCAASDQITAKHCHQPPQCSCHHYHHQSASPPANFPRPLPTPPSPPPPVPSFSNNHQFSRRYRQSYSKTPPPSFHGPPPKCTDDHCYQEYSLNQMADSRQKLIVSHHQIKSSTYNHHSNCCTGYQKKQCCRCCHSKCSACGSLFYDDEYSSQAAHYNISDLRTVQCSSTPLSDSVFEQSLMPKSLIFASPINFDESFNCRCLCNHSTQRYSETSGRHSTEMRKHSCRNSASHRSSTQTYGVADKERSSSKRRKNSSHSYHGSNHDPDTDDKHESSRNHHNSPATNMLPTTSVHLSPDLNINSTSCDSTMSGTNNNNNISNISNSINNMMQSSNVASQNDRKQHHFEPWRKTFHDNMMALRNLGWYWGPLNHLEAENLVHGRPDGTFLVRDSGNEAYFLSLTFRVLGTTYHTRIEYSQGKFSFWSQPESHSAITIVEFIDKAVAHSVSGKFHYFLQTNTPGQPPMEVSLLYPLSRYQIVQSLQHLSRFIILSNIRRDHVSQLELPQSIKGYLMEKQYYIDCIETFVKITKDSEPLTYEPSGNMMRPL